MVPLNQSTRKVADGNHDVDHGRSEDPGRRRWVRVRTVLKAGPESELQRKCKEHAEQIGEIELRLRLCSHVDVVLTRGANGAGAGIE